MQITLARRNNLEVQQLSFSSSPATAAPSKSEEDQSALGSGRARLFPALSKDATPHNHFKLSYDWVTQAAVLIIRTLLGYETFQHTRAYLSPTPINWCVCVRAPKKTFVR